MGLILQFDYEADDESSILDQVLCANESGQPFSISKIEYYISEIRASPTLDPLMYKNRQGLDLGLNEQEKANLVAFLKTLTDDEFINNPFSASHGK